MGKLPEVYRNDIGAREFGYYRRHYLPPSPTPSPRWLFCMSSGLDRSTPVLQCTGVLFTHSILPFKNISIYMYLLVTLCLSLLPSIFFLPVRSVLFYSWFLSVYLPVWSLFFCFILGFCLSICLFGLFLFPSRFLSLFVSCILYFSLS